MANFDEDIKRITEQVLSDGTVDEIIRAKIVKGFESAIEDAFSWGVLNKAIKERVKTVLVPFIENYKMDDYLVKMDTLLTELIEKSVLVDNKKMFENFQFMLSDTVPEEIKLSELFEQYKNFVARNMETVNRHVSFDSEEPEYEQMELGFCFEEEEKRTWSSFRYATIDFTVEEKDQQDELNRTIRLNRYEHDRKEGWEIRIDTNPDIYSFRFMDEFDLLLSKLQRAHVRVTIDKEEGEDFVYSKNKPEVTWE